jgi:tRNA A37 threonylcarbamoyladenosine dehydratase
LVKGVDRIRKSFVVVVGLGGVGSHAAHMLVRSGVQRLRLIDFDQVTLSSLNRHAVATHSDVGTAKAVCLAEHFENICPHATIEPIVDLFTLERAEQLLDGHADYVLDCIDNIDTKIELIKYCVDRNIKIISSMGSGAKADPSRICIADISYTQEDALARSVRKRLRKLGIEYGVPVVYSLEKPGEIGLLPLEDEKVNQAEDFALLPNFRSRILPGNVSFGLMY